MVEKARKEGRSEETKGRGERRRGGGKVEICERKTRKWGIYCGI
jgi:hypothetical protein